MKCFICSVLSNCCVLIVFVIAANYFVNKLSIIIIFIYRSFSLKYFYVQRKKIIFVLINDIGGISAIPSRSVHWLKRKQLFAHHFFLSRLNECAIKLRLLSALWLDVIIGQVHVIQINTKLLLLLFQRYMWQKEVETEWNHPNKQRWNRKTWTENVKIYYKFDIIVRMRTFRMYFMWLQCANNRLVWFCIALRFVDTNNDVCCSLGSYR